MTDMGDVGLTDFQVLGLGWDNYFVGIRAYDDFGNESEMASPVLVGLSTDLDRDRDVDGKDLARLISNLEDGETDPGVGAAAADFGKIF